MSPDERPRPEVLDEAVAEQQAAERASRLVAERQREGFRGDIHRLAQIVSTEGEGRLLPLLISRGERRSATNAVERLLMPSWMWRAGIGVGTADVLLERLDTPWHTDLPVDETAQVWALHLRGGLDSFARVAWCLRFGYTTAAVAIARKAFERWSFNIASSMELEVLDNESEDAFYTRVWQASGNYVDERELGAEWGLLSELLHSRTAELAGRHIALSLDMQLVDRTRIHRFVALFAEVWLRQVRGAVIRLALENNKLSDDEAQMAWLPVNAIKGLPAPPEFLFVFWEPLLHGFVTSEDAERYLGWGATYRRMVATRATRALDLGIASNWMSIEERWARSIEVSQRSFQREQEALGDEFSPFSVRVRVSRYRLICEMADLLADSMGQSHQGDAMRAAAAALESAWVMWLQDIDDSLTLARSVLESTARARTHRRKPLRALKLENGPQAHKTPTRWVDEAGWGRLSPFMRALNEYSHMQGRSRHRESWSLLVKVQELEPSAAAQHTARGHALERVAVMLAHEVIASLTPEWESLSKEFSDLVLLEGNEAESERDFERWLNVTLGLKATHSFDPPDYP
ncbi:hypothetical protein LJR042_001850 [Microbacterium maritypicum]|uniref:hypothetical protein n=1 Tax=Microbacterium maritypicum TaxID=33918 RepID=UPI003ED0564B